MRFTPALAVAILSTTASLAAARYTSGYSYDLYARYAESEPEWDEFELYDRDADAEAEAEYDDEFYVRDVLEQALLRRALLGRAPVNPGEIADAGISAITKADDAIKSTRKPNYRNSFLDTLPNRGRNPNAGGEWGKIKQGGDTILTDLFGGGKKKGGSS